MTRRILIVDDAEDVLEVARLSLELTTSWEVMISHDGPEAIARCEAEPPDLLLLDVMMPGLDGPATLARLRQHPVTRHVPVVFLTARVREADRERYLAMGAVGVIAKPFESLELADRLRALMGW